MVVERNLDPALAADVIEDARRDGDAEFFLQEHRLGAGLDGVVVPVRGAVPSGGTAAALVFDRVDAAVLLLDQIELGRDAQAFRTQLNTPGVQGLPLLA